MVNVSLALLPIFTQNLMFIRCSMLLSLIFPPTVYHGDVLLPLLLGNERIIWYVAHVNEGGTCPNVFEYTSLPDSAPQRHAATNPGIKLSHLVYVSIYTQYIHCIIAIYEFSCLSVTDKIHHVKYNILVSLYYSTPACFGF